MIRIKRVYAAADKTDGWRVLVDGLWPRGLTREAASLDAWLKEVAPTPALRRWFGHDAARWDEFKRRYALELEGHEAALNELARRGRQGRVTLLFAAADEIHNNAAALKTILESLRPER